MYSDGEKIPPDEPDPRLTDVATSFATESSARKGAVASPPKQHVLYRRIADAFDPIVAGEAKERIHHRANEGHADGVAQIGILDPVELVFRQVQAADESRRPQRPPRTPRIAYSDQDVDRRTGERTGSRRAGTSNAGRGPKKSRPTKVAVPVASATGRKVRVLTSGIMSSIGENYPADRRVEGGGDARARSSGY